MTAPLLGKPWNERRSGDAPARPGDHRAFHDRDRARVIHSAAFRRLQSKTQVLGTTEGDFHRTRLTHSMEAAQIALGLQIHLARAVPDDVHDALPPPTLIEAIALAHDLGHPPFGHAGEAALNHCMRHDGGFEGNAQTLRLLGWLEGGPHGLDLARRTLLGVLKYPVPIRPPPPRADAPFRPDDWRPAKGHYKSEAALMDWILDPFAPADRARFQETDAAGDARWQAFDTTLMDVADDIAYGVHDLEDAIALGLIERDELRDVWDRHAGSVRALPAAPDDAATEALLSPGSRKAAVGAFVNFFIVNGHVIRREGFAHPLLTLAVILPDEARALLDVLKNAVRRHVIDRPAMRMLEHRGQHVVRAIFDALAADPDRFLPDHDPADPARAVCDHVADMSDDRAIRVYERLFVPRTRTAFEPG